MKSIKKKLVTLGVVLSLCFVAGFIFNCFVSKGSYCIDLSLLLTERTMIFTAFFALVALLIFMLKKFNNIETSGIKQVLLGTEADKRIDVNLEQSRFMTDREINENFIRVEHGDLKNKEISGIPIRTEQKRNKLYINFAPDAHTLVIGTTGSGKTSTFVSPMIQILSQSKSKPSLFITDPKGELFSLHAKSLQDKGYDIKVLDLRNPFNSVKWNPLERPFAMYQRMLKLEEKIKIETDGLYTFDGNTYKTHDEAAYAAQIKRQALFDCIYEDLHDIVNALCPITNQSEPIWESGARNLILAILLAMLQDSENPEFNMTKEKYNFYNLTKIATNTEKDCEELIKYFQGRGKLSKAHTLSKQVLDASEKTRGSYLSTVFDKLNLFADLSICSLTSANEITFSDMAETPTAFFLQIPDEKETRYTIASMVILQAYKELVAKANTYPSLSLPRNVYFIMEEFGSLPRIPKLEQMVTIGRSRKIWLCLVVQSYTQLANVYDEKCSNIIQSNCNNQIFIGTTDIKTIEDFSKRCGNYSVITHSVGYNSSKPEDINDNSSIRERPLIYPSELSKLNRPGNMGNAVITIFGYMPIISKFVPSYACAAFDLSSSTLQKHTQTFFNEAEVFYDITRRNRIVFKAKCKAEKQNDDISETIKEIIENLDTDILSEEDKISLFNYLDKQKYPLVKKMLHVAEETANALQKNNLADTFKSLFEKIDYLQAE